MDQETFLTDLPSETIIDILSRLPVRSIIICKCVCKSWFGLLNSLEFSKTHLSNSIPGVVTYSFDLFKTFEFVDSLDNLENHELHYNPLTECVKLQGSVNGLLFLWEICEPNLLYICNPITQDYIKLPSPGGKAYRNPSVVTYGFGVSKTSGQHKLVRIFHDFAGDTNTHLLSNPNFVCQIYTLGTGSWRSIVPGGATLTYKDCSIPARLNGNLHWLVQDLQFSCRISCFDLQTELFSTFSPPAELQQRSEILIHLGSLVVLGRLFVFM